MVNTNYMVNSNYEMYTTKRGKFRIRRNVVVSGIPFRYKFKFDPVTRDWQVKILSKSGTTIRGWHTVSNNTMVAELYKILKRYIEVGNAA